MADGDEWHVVRWSGALDRHVAARFAAIDEQLMLAMLRLKPEYVPRIRSGRAAYSLPDRARASLARSTRKSISPSGTPGKLLNWWGRNCVRLSPTNPAAGSPLRKRRP